MKIIFCILLSLSYSANINAFDWNSLSDTILMKHLELFKNNEDCIASIERNHMLRSESIVKNCMTNLQANETDTIMMRENVDFLNARTKFYVWIKGKEELSLSYFYYTFDNGNNPIAKEGNTFSNYIIERIYDEWDLPLIKRLLQPNCQIYDYDGYCVLTRLIPIGGGQYKIESLKYSLNKE